MKNTFVLLFLLFNGFLSVSAQDANNGVRLLARPAETDSIMLRWAPADKETWKLDNMHGYIVERYTILRDGQLLEDKERRTLTAVPLKPQPIDV
jgi:hypothetical protein